MRKVVFRDFRVVDGDGEFFGSLVVENGVISEIISNTYNETPANLIINGSEFGDSAALMPAFVDMHSHFRDPGGKGNLPPSEVSFPAKISLPAEVSFPAEMAESGSLAAVAGGFVTVVCMANTKPAIDTIEKARILKIRCNTIGLVDLYPVISLTKNMEGGELSGIKDLVSVDNGGVRLPVLLSEDGKDVIDDDVFLAAMGEAKRLGIPVSCHCDKDGENNAVRRAIELGKKAGCHIHIAHVSTKESAEIIREAKKNGNGINGFFLTCEVTPHHIGASEDDARRMGTESYGRVNPPLRTEADRQAIIAAINDGTIDAIATDHAPHTESDKASGAPGFSGLETAFTACYSSLPLCAPLSHCEGKYETGLQRISALMSANPAQILGLQDRGRIAEGLRADLVIVDTHAEVKVDPEKFKSRGLCSPFAGKTLQGRVLFTMNAGRIVYGGY